jgi:hypothetical protein
MLKEIQRNRKTKVMSKQAQVYWLALPKVADIKDVRPGQFVFHDNADNEVRGFIAEVDRANKRALFCLFEPAKVKAKSIVVHEHVEDSWWKKRLGDILKADAQIAEHWAKHSAANWLSVN